MSIINPKGTAEEAIKTISNPHNEVSHPSHHGIHQHHTPSESKSKQVLTIAEEATETSDIKPIYDDTNKQ